jgi:hypothetical protein
MLRRIFLLLFLVTLTACAALDLKRPVNDEDAAGLHKVGVVSLLGDTFHGISIGTTVFTNAQFSASVPEWNIDDFAALNALSVLRENGKFHAELLNHPNLRAEQLSADKAKLVWELAQQQGFDTLVVLWPSVSTNYPHFIPGYGYFERSMLGLGSRCLYAGYTVETYKVAAHKRIAWEWGGEMPCRTGSEKTIPYREKFEDYSDAEKQLMRKAIEDRISETVRYALTKLSLVSDAKSP